MRGKWCLRRWAAMPLLHMLLIFRASDAKLCGEFQVLGVFDDSDLESIRAFRDSLGNFSRLARAGATQACAGTVSRRELLLNDQMAAITVVNTTAEVFSGGKICFVVYSSFSSNGLFALDYALGREIPVVSTIPKKVITVLSAIYASRQDHSHYLYDPAKVIGLRERSPRSRKSQVILNFLLKMGHKEFVTITSTEFEDIQVVTALHGLAKSHNLAMDWFVIPTSDYMEAINSASMRFMNMKSKPYHFVIITDDMMLIDIIFKAVFTAMEEQRGPAEYLWILVSDMDFEVVLNTNFQMSVFAILPRVGNGLANRYYVEDSIGMLEHVWKKMMKTKSRRSCPTNKWIHRQLPRIALPGKDGRAVSFNQDGQRLHETYDVYWMYMEMPREPAIYNVVGNWSNGKLAVTLGEQPPTLRVVIIEYAPYIMSQHKIDPYERCKSQALSCFKTVTTEDGEKREEERCCYGFAIDVLKMAINKKFNLRLIFSEDGVYGAKGDNGSWNGIVRDLIEGRADMSPDLFPTSSRSEALDFTEPYMPTGIALLVKERKRDDKEIYWTSFMRPFEPKLWYIVIAAVGFLIAFLWFADKVSPSISDRRIFHWNAPFCLDNAVCYVLQLTFGRPADEKKPRTNGARLTSVTFGLAMMIIIASYSANLAAFLIVNDMTTPVDGIHHEKMKNPPPGFHYGTLEGSFMDSFFKTSDKELFKKVWSTMEKNNVGSLVEGVKSVRSGELDVFIGDSVGLQYEALNDPYCELKMVGEPFAMTGASFAVKKGSDHFNTLSEALGELKSQGLTDFIQTYWVKKFSCTKVIPPTQLQLEDLSGLFLQMTICLLLCVFCNFSYLGWIQMMKAQRKCNSKRKAQIEEDMQFKTDKVHPEFEPLRETNL